MDRLGGQFGVVVQHAAKSYGDGVDAPASSRLARPMTALASWITVGILRRYAASTGGKVG